MRFTIFFFTVIIFFSCNRSSTGGNSNDQVSMEESILPIYTFSQVVTNGSLPSPRKEITGTSGDIELVIDYGSPSVKGRDVWGDLVALNEVWRTGANEATILDLKNDALIEGQELVAGKYSLFTIPTENKWTVIFNKTYDQWGAYEYDENQDVLRVTVKPSKQEKLSETLEFTIAENEIAMWWEYLKLPIKIEEKS